MHPPPGLIDISGSHDLVWPSSLAPKGSGTFDLEPFSEWWERNCRALDHLHPQIAEQWLHRHWRQSPYCNLPLDRMSWVEERWPTKAILEKVDMADKARLDPQWDFKHLGRVSGEPAQTMGRTGTWNIPILILATDGNAWDLSGPRPDIEFWLIEGHLRYRYLNALYAKKQCVDTHGVFIIRIT